MIFDIGPFRLYRVEKDGTLDVSLKCMDDWSCGWEYGYRDYMRGEVDKPLIQIRIKKLMVLYFEFYPKRDGTDCTGFEAWFMGFWWIK